MVDLVELRGDIWQIDLNESGYPGRTAAYFVKGADSWLLVETGPTSSVDVIIEAAKELHISPGEVKYIAVSHIHIDHAGGLGVASEYFTEAEMLVHYKGARHMVEPQKLIKGATAAWGEKKMAEFGEIKPIDKERLISVSEGDKIDLGNRTIEVWESLGHSKFHVSFYDSKTNGIFCGDMGVYFPLLSEKFDKPVIRISTPFPELNGEHMLNCLHRVSVANLDKIYFAHFGQSKEPKLLCEILIGQLMNSLKTVSAQLDKPNPKEITYDILMSNINKYLFGSTEEAIQITSKRMEGEWEYLTYMFSLSISGMIKYLEEEDSIKL